MGKASRYETPSFYFGGLEKNGDQTAHNEHRYGNILSTMGKNFTLRNCETPVTTQVLKLARKLPLLFSET